MESQPQNPEFRINPENFHPWYCIKTTFTKVQSKSSVTARDFGR